jgi:hypothetical protein
MECNFLKSLIPNLKNTRIYWSTYMVHDNYIYGPAQTIVYCGSIWLKIRVAHQLVLEVFVEIERNLGTGL